MVIPSISKQTNYGDKEIADFNGLVPKPEEAPSWAKKPLPPLDYEVPYRKVNIACLLNMIKLIGIYAV